MKPKTNTKQAPALVLEPEFSVLTLRLDDTDLRLLNQVKDQFNIKVSSKAIIKALEIVTGDYSNLQKETQALKFQIRTLQEWKNKVLINKYQADNHTKILNKLLSEPATELSLFDEFYNETEF